MATPCKMLISVTVQEHRHMMGLNTVIPSESLRLAARLAGALALSALFS